MPVKFLRSTLSRQRAAFSILLFIFIGTLLFLGLALSRSFHSFTTQKQVLRQLQTNITDLTRLEAALGNSESRFRAFLLSGDSIWWKQLEEERSLFYHTADKLAQVPSINMLIGSIKKGAQAKFDLQNGLADEDARQHYTPQKRQTVLSAHFAPDGHMATISASVRTTLSKAQELQLRELTTVGKAQDHIHPVIKWQFAAIVLLIVLLMLFLLNNAYRDMAQRARTTALMHTLLASAHDGFYLLSTSWRILLMNNKARDYLNASFNCDAHRGDNLLDLLPEKDREDVKQLYQRALDGEQIVLQRQLIMNGQQRIIELQHRTVFDTDLDKNTGISILLRDITEQTIAEEARLKSEATRHMIMNAVQDAVVCINKEGKISYWNNKAEDIFEWTEKEAIGLTLHETIIPSYHRADYKERFDQYQKTGENRALNKLVELTAVSKTGREFSVEMYILALSDGSEEFICAFIRDISERKHAENLRNALLERLRLTNGMVQLGSWQLDIATNQLKCDEVVYAVLELDSSVILNRENWLRHIHPEDRGQVAAQLNSFIEQGTELELYFRVITPAGKTKYLYQKAVKYLDAAGKIYDVFGGVIDVTQLKKAEATFRQVVNASPNALLLVNERGRIMLANQQAEKLFGYPEAELINATIEQLMPHRFARHHSALHGKYMQYPEARTLGESRELFALRKDGTEVPIEIGLSPMEQEGNKMVLASVVDISQRKAAEAERQELLTRFELAASATQMGIWDFDLVCSTLLWNNNMYDLVAQPRNTPVSFKVWRNLIHKEDLQLTLQVFEHAVEQGLPHFEMEYRVVLPDGTVKVLHQKAITFRNAEGVVVRCLGTSLDVTEQRQAYAVREELLTRFELVAETLHLGILDADLLTGTVQGDTQLKLMMGIEGIPKPDWRVWMRQVHPADRDNMQSLLLQALPQGKLLQAEWRQLRPNGELRFFETKARMIWKSGQPSRLIAATIDITSRVNQRNELIAAKTHAEKSEQLQEQFLANMSHEIRTPLNGIVGMTDLMSGTTLTNRQREYLQVIQNSSQSLLTIINDVLDISKIKSGKFTIENAPFNLHRVITSSFELLQHRAGQKELAYQLEVGANVPEMVKGDAGRLSQVLINLLGNAVKFTREGSVVFKVHPAGMNKEKLRLLFTVTDTGIGISAAAKEDIFNSFAQGSREVSVEFGGTGLGLAISRQLIAMQGGTIEVESTLGMGSSFRVLLDYEVITEPAEKETVATTPRSAEGHVGKRVLVAEDNEVNRMVINEYLQKVGLLVTMAHDGKQAIEILLSQPPFDLIILDLRMPLMNGFETAVAIRKELYLETPIMALSASTLRSEKDNCLAMGMNAYMAKPFKAFELYDNIFRLLSGSGTQLPANGMQAAATTAPALYDLSELEQLGEADFALQIIDTFIENGQETLREMNDAFSGGRMAAVFELAHRMKSSAGMLGAAELMELLRQTETEARLDSPDKEKLETLIGQTQLQFGNVSEALEKAKPQVLTWQ